MTVSGSGRLRLLIVRGADDPLPDWHAMLLDRLALDPRIEIVGMLAGQGPAHTQNPRILVRWVLAAERCVVARQLLPYYKTSAQVILSDLPAQTSVAPADLALELGTRGLAQDQLGVARHGTWAMTFGGGFDATRVAMAAEQRASAGMLVQILQRSATAPEPRLVRATQYNLKPGAILTGAFVEEKSILFILRALRDLAEGRARGGVDTEVRPAPLPLRASEVISYAGSFAKVALSKLREKWRARRGRAPEFWRLACGTGDLIDMAPRNATPLPALSHTMADPFLFQDNGKTWVFYEAMNADDGAGWIDVAELDGETLKAPATALACPYHLSFPFVFRDGEDIYMLPETQQSRRLEVWRATDFPTKWERHATAFEGMFLADSTLWQADDKQWWLLTNLSDHHAFQDHSSELYLFSVDGPALGSVVPHPGNPVAIGADHARNAGALIRQNGRLFRPSQNNSYGVYGYGLNLMEITRLDASGYEEKRVRKWTPEDRADMVGIHHLTASGERYVFDWSGT